MIYLDLTTSECIHERTRQGMKLGQFEGVHPKLLPSKFQEIWSKPGGVDHPPCFFFKNDQTNT